MQKLFNKDVEDLKSKQTDMNNTITEIKNRGINSRTNEAEERISKQEDRMVEITATEQNEEKMKINKDF